MTMNSQTRVVLKPEQIPPVAIDFMNNTHFEEIAMVQDLGNMIEKYQASPQQTDEQRNAITQALENWFQHTQAHFSRENELMNEVHFPAYAVHAEEHSNALARLREILDSWNLNHDIESLADYIFTIWPGWFSRHVQTMDAMTAKFAILNGFEPE